MSPAYRPAVLFMAFLGLRSGEAIAVLGGDVTPLVGTLLVRRQDDGFRGWTTDLKTEESRRELPIPAALWAEIEACRAGSDVPLTRTRDTKAGPGIQVSEAVLRRAVATARERIGLPPCKGHTLHALRHGASTWLATNGCPRGVRLAILGQSRGDVEDRYVHSGPVTMLPYLQAMWEASEGAERVEPQKTGGAKKPARGMSNGRAKITDAMRAEILRRLEDGEAVKAVARDLKISPKAVRNARASTSRVVVTTTLEGDRVPLS